MRPLLVAFAIAAACGTSRSEIREPSRVANASPPRAAAPSTILPADAVTVARGPGRDGPILAYFESLFRNTGRKLPRCFEEITSRIEDQYQLEVGASLRQVHVLVGAFDRGAAEDCVGTVDLAIALILGPDGGVHLSAQPDGALTKLTQVTPRGTRTAWIAWSPHRVVVAGDPDLARAVLGGAHPMRADAPLARLWAGTEGGELRFATVRDFTSRMLGVPSWGLRLSATRDAMHAGGHIEAHIELASEGDAAHALAALAALPQAPGASPALARMVELMAPRREGAELVVDVGAVFAAPDGIATLQALVGTP